MGKQVKTWGNIVKSISKTYDKHKKNIGKHIRKAYGGTIQKAHKESIRNKKKGTPLALARQSHKAGASPVFIFCST